MFRPAPGPSVKWCFLFPNSSGVRGCSAAPQECLWPPRADQQVCLGWGALKGKESKIFCVKSIKAPSPSGHEAQQKLFKITICCPFSDYKSNTYSWSKIWKIQKSTEKKIHPYFTTQTQPLLIFEVYHPTVLPFLSVSLSLSFNENLMQ